MGSGRLAVIVRGPSRPLAGTVRVQGSKSAFSKLVGAAALSSGPSSVTAAPRTTDADALLTLLGTAGWPVNRSGDVVVIGTPPGPGGQIHLGRPDTRGAILLLPALLAALGRVRFGPPRGCDIGERALTWYLDVLAAFGADVGASAGHYDVRLAGLRPTDLTLPAPSVAGTSLALLCASRAPGRSRLANLSREPEVDALAAALRTMGATIDVTGRSAAVFGTETPAAVETMAPADRNAAFTLVAAVAATGGRAELDARPRDGIVDSVLERFLDEQRLPWSPTERGIEIDATDWHPVATDLRASWYPGFPTDWQPLAAALLTQAEGRSSVADEIFEDRLRYWHQYARMGIVAEHEGNAVTVRGPQSARGTVVDALDIRAGAAVVILALMAEGKTLVRNAAELRRGYDDLVADLAALGAPVEAGGEVEGASL